MDAPTSAASVAKPLASDTAEEICKSLEQAILRYFAQIDVNPTQAVLRPLGPSPGQEIVDLVRPLFISA
jgi:hypothetical protein